MRRTRSFRCPEAANRLNYRSPSALVTAMRRTAHRHAFCRECGYYLFGLTDHCPECGRPFDPNDLFSYSPPTIKREWSAYAMWAVVIVFALVVVAAMLL